MVDKLEEKLKSDYIISKVGGEKVTFVNTYLSSEGDNPFKLDQEFGDENNTEGIMFTRRPHSNNNNIIPQNRFKNNR